MLLSVAITLCKNSTSQTIKLMMGFPFLVYNQGEGDVALPKGRTVQNNGSLVHDFSVTFDGQSIKVRRVNIKPNLQKKMYYKDAYLWPMIFSPHDTVMVHHDYITGVTFDVMGHTWVEYVLRTGGL